MSHMSEVLRRREMLKGSRAPFLMEKEKSLRHNATGEIELRRFICLNGELRRETGLTKPVKRMQTGDSGTVAVTQRPLAWLDKGLVSAFSVVLSATT